MEVQLTTAQVVELNRQLLDDDAARATAAQQPAPVPVAPAMPVRDAAPPTTPGDDPLPPPVPDIARWIEAQPRMEHSMGRIMAHFAGRSVPTRTGFGRDAKSNPAYSRWMAAVSAARAMLEQKHGAKFLEVRNGRTVDYTLTVATQAEARVGQGREGVSP